jgi:glycosyltransferase involved in cell wall biosynthesis
MAYLVSHPIQYQAPLLHRISREPNIDLTVFFCSDLSVGEYQDGGFGIPVRWDVPLLEGYRYEFLPAIGGTRKLSFWRPFNYGLAKRLGGRFDVLWVHGWGCWSHLWAIRTCKHLGIKVMLRGESSLHLEPADSARATMRRKVLKGLINRADALLAIGTMNREFYLSYGADPRRIYMMPYAVDNLLFQARAAEAAVEQERLRETLGLEPRRPVILFASKMTEKKRAGDLLEAYLRLSPDGRREPEPYVLFVGDGEQRPILERRAAEIGWASIRFLGFKNQTELPAYYNLCDVFVLPSVQEPWGLVVNEVMNAGRAVVVSDEVGCARDLVHDGVNGRIFRARDVQGLAKALGSVLESHERTAEMGKKSRGIIDRWGFEEDMDGLRRALAGVACRE